MPDKSELKKKKLIKQAIENLNHSYMESVIDISLDKNIEMLRKLFEDVDIFKIREIRGGGEGKHRYCLAYLDCLVSDIILNDNIIKPLMLSKLVSSGENLIDAIEMHVIPTHDMEKTDSLSKIIEAVCSGDTALFAEGASQVLLMNTTEYPTRQLEEPESEKTLSGPKEGFNESLLINLSLLCRRVKSPELKIRLLNIGRRTRTKVCICYIKGLADEKVLNELYKRLSKIDIDGILDVNYINELIKDQPYSLFRSTGKTSRPDTLVGKILEGRIGLLVDGTPDAITVPYLFIENFQSCDDYYINFFYSSFFRFLRIVTFIITITVPGLYVAVVAFNHEMLPTQLLISAAAERQSVPLPAALEAFIMLMVFNILREAGLRMSANIGQALSIVGALVIGQAAVEAKLVAAPMIVVIGLTAISSLTVPQLNSSSIILRLFLLLLASCFGFYGLILGMSAILVYILNLRSFGICQVSPEATFRQQNIKDLFIRAPFDIMKDRPVTSVNPVRMELNENDDA